MTSTASSPTSPTSLPTGYTLHDGFPPTAAYLHLRSASGLSPKNPLQAAAVANGSWYGCYITYRDRALDPVIPNSSGSGSEGNTADIQPPVVVAMGRIIGDGGWYFHIADMAVLPTHQRRGLGDVILKTLLARIRRDAAPGEPYVTLFADEAGRRLYTKNGFVEAAPMELGMVMRLNREEKEEMEKTVVDFSE